MLNNKVVRVGRFFIGVFNYGRLLDCYNVDQPSVDTAIQAIISELGIKLSGKNVEVFQQLYLEEKDGAKVAIFTCGKTGLGSYNYENYEYSFRVSWIECA